MKFTKGFYFNKPSQADQNYESSSYIKDYEFLGIVRQYDDKEGYAVVEQRNKICIGDKVEIFGPYTDCFEQIIEIMYNDAGEQIQTAPHAQQIIKIKMDRKVEPNFIIRKRSGY